MRQTWEEIGIDLAEKDFMLIGQLDDREITTSLGKRLLMILSPYGTGIHCSVMSPLVMTFSSFPASDSQHASTRPNAWHASPLDSAVFFACIGEDKVARPVKGRIRRPPLDDSYR